MNLRSCSLALLALTLSPVFAAAQLPAAPKPPIVNDPALRIELIATLPEIEAPTTVCGDPHGAIYVGNDPRDGRLSTDQPVCTIVRFSSRGAERKRTVFADKLYSPAGSAWHAGYLYVLHDPLLTRFKDTDGDGVADIREDLVTNLGIPPNASLNDHVVSGFTLGMDGFFYLSVGDRGIFQAKSVKDGSTITMQGGGIARCRTDGTQLEVFSTGTRNHLQVNLDAEDNAFTRDNTDDGNGWWTRLTHHIEGGYYGYPYDFRKAPNYGVAQPSQQTLDAIKQHGGAIDLESTTSDGRKVGGLFPNLDAPQPQKNETFLPAMADFGPGSPTGGLCYLSDGLPEQYRGKHFFSDWGKQGVFVTEVARDGATFKLVSDTKLIEPEKGADFRPMQLSVAADGSLLIADWGYGGWKSPKVAGAIWRLSWPEAKPAPRLADESKASVEELLAALGHPDRDQRLRAQAALVKLGDGERAAIRTWEDSRISPKKPALAQLTALAENETASSIARSHALWTLENVAGRALDVLAANWTQANLDTALPGLSIFYEPLYRVLPASYRDRPFPGSKDAVVRAQAVRALGVSRWRFDCEVIVEAGLKLLNDPRAEVRREAVMALGRAAYEPVPHRLVAMLDDADAWVRFAARRSLVEVIEVYGLASYDLDSKDLAKAALTEHEWQTLEGVALTRGKHAAPRTRGRSIGALEDEVPQFIADRLAGKIRATPADRARAAAALAHFAYQPKPYGGHWWGTQPVKSPPPLNSVPWAGTPPALAALTAALADTDSGVRLAAAKAFTGFILSDRVAPAPSQVVPGAPAGKPTAGAPAGQNDAERGGDDSAARVPTTTREGACATLRARLLAETDAAIRRQIIEALGVQKDVLAMDVFRKIALGDPDMQFRETAIGAVVNIGGEAAKKTIAQLADAELSPAATRKIITAAGELKVLEAAPALIAYLRHENAGNREFSAKSLQQLGPKSGAGPALIEAMTDKDGKVQAAAIEALGSFREKAAVPALIALAEKKKMLKETLGALANMPDERAIPVLVETLREKNSGHRRNAIKALKTMREKAWPQVEALLASGRVPEELVPEIRHAFDSGAIVKWKMVGVFENVWDAVHPPEKDVLANGGAAHLSAKYHNAEGKDVSWIDVTADATEGRVDLAQVFKTTAMVCAYASAEIDAPEAAEAKLFTSADDELAVWLNGQRVLNLPGSHGYEADKNETLLELKAGKNQLFVKIGNKSGSWVFHARLPGFENGKFIKSKEPTLEEKQRLFALAAKPDGTFINAGKAKNGEKLFFEQGAAMGGICATCHAVGARGGQIGPALTTVGANYKRADLITSLLEPSKTIALGFEQVMLETSSGETIAGSLRAESADAFTIVDAAGQSKAVKKADVKTKTDLHMSLMPPGLTLSLKPEEFADLLAYLESLKG